MSFASRLWPGLPLLAAVVMTPVGTAATVCHEAGSTRGKSTLGSAGTNVRARAMSRGCPRDCARQQPEAPKGSEREVHAPLPLSIVPRAEDVADWHADIFERLRGEHFEDGVVRFCGIAPPVRPL